MLSLMKFMNEEKNDSEPAASLSIRFSRIVTTIEKKPQLT
jgi:hypothetical protein